VSLSTRRVLILNSRLYQVFYGLMVCPWYAYSQTMISEVSPLPQMSVFSIIFRVVSILRCCFLPRFLFFALFSVVYPLRHLRGSPAEVKYDRLARLLRLSDHSYLKRLYLPRGTMTTCRSRSCLACEHLRPLIGPPWFLHDF